MPRLIDANMLKAKFPVTIDFGKNLWHSAIIRSAIDDAPTVDAVPVVHGRWNFLNDYQSRCSECHEVMWVDHNAEPNYCPNCGADMRERRTDG